ncbi:MAG TPA: serine hydrolase [Paucimonas sp.]|nr:serine hydrolase [Paucimonas sp.]
MKIQCIHAAVLALTMACAAAGAQTKTPEPSSAPAAAAPHPKTQYRDALRLIDLWLDAQQAYDRIPGLSAGVVAGDDLIWSKGYGTIDIKGKVPAASDTIYSVCSISKLFTSVAVMQLWEQGKLRLDDDIGAVLPDFAIRRTAPDGAPLTIRSLLTHSSGLPRESDFPYWTGPDFTFPTRTQLQEKLKEQPMLMPASDRFQYSNLGMALLGEIVAKVSGMPYDDYVRRHILDPLKLADTRTRMPTELYGKRLAHGFSALRRDGTRNPVKPFEINAITPAAGFSSTVEDLARFASWQFRLLDGGAAEILRPSTLREMQRVQWIDPDGKTTWGLGFAVTRDGNKTYVGHGGSCPGYRTALTMMPADKLGVIFMSNAMVETSAYVRPLRKLLDKGKKLEPAKIDLETYAGRYVAQPWNGETVIVPWGAHLAVLDLPNNDPAGDMTVLKHVGNDTFRRLRDDESLAEEVVFERGADGKIARMRWHSNVSGRLGGLTE